MEIDFEKRELIQFMDKAVKCVFESYRFINIYLTKVEKNEKNDDVLTDASILSSDDDILK